MQLQLHYTNYTTPQLQLHYNYNYNYSFAATPKNTAPTTFRSISGFALPSAVIHSNQSLL